MGRHMTQGTWTPQKSRMHINILELQAVQKACQAFLPSHLYSHHVLIIVIEQQHHYLLPQQTGGHKVNCAVCEVGQSMELVYCPQDSVV